jgi:serine/threonine-protein kinase
MEFTKLGKYEIVARLGAGAMGEVWKARDPVLNRFVAIKVMSASLESDPELVQRFQREAQSAARLNHGNIITVFDFGQDQGRLYMAMELLEGSDLKEVIAQRALPELWDRVLVMEQIADGLAFAHSQGIVHRDVKPANVHVLPNGRVKIMDFGLARIETSEMTHQGMVMGTPNYMAPEQVQGRKADARSDVFSCGALFYELLAGRKAFSGESMTAILNKVLEGRPEPLAGLVPGLPAELTAIVERALAKDPSARYPDAREMLEAVRGVRERMESGELASGALGAEATLNGLDAPTVASLDHAPSSLRSARTVAGNTALDISRRPRVESRPGAPTLSGQDRTQSGGWRSPLPLVAAGVLVAGGGAAAWFLSRPPAAPPATMAPAELAREQVGILKESLVASQLDLARLSLADKDFGAALRAAEAALKVDAANAEAQQLRDQARRQLAALDAAASEARSAFDRGDTAVASAALGRVLALDPRHPVAAELTSKLNEFFRDQAADARGAMNESRAAARGASSQDGHARALALVREGEALYASREYAVAAQKFMEARDGFDRARRASEAAAEKERQAAAAAAAAAQRQATAATRPAAPPTTVAAVRPTAPPPTAPPATAAPAASAPASGAAAAVVPVNPVSPHEAAVRALLADYTAALEGKSLEGFRAVKPNLTPDEEKRLAASFKAIKSWKVGMQVESMVMDGGRIVVRVQRQDNVNGRETPKVTQYFTLAQQGGGWKIESIGQ